jgi:hypothetical protein
MKVNPRLLRLLTGIVSCLAGDSDEERPFFAPLLVKMPCQIVADHARQADVQKDNIRLMVLGRAKSGRAIWGDVDLMTFGAEQKGQVLGRVLVILDC